MPYAQLPGVHTLPDGSTVDVTVNGSTAELAGTDTHGDASFTVALPLARAAVLLEGAAA